MQAWGNKGYPAPPLRKHAESQQNDGNTGSCAYTSLCMFTGGPDVRNSHARCSNMSHG